MIALRTWEQIHNLFRNILANLADTSDASSRLLVEQFIQFLEYSGMTGFTGFRPDHFDYFMLHDDDDARRWVRDQVTDFAAQVLPSLQKVSPFYEDYDVGNLALDASYCWVAFGPRGAMYRKVTHQSLSLNANGLLVFVNTELKPATDRLKAVLSQSAKAFTKKLLAQHAIAPFELVIEERVQRQAMVYDYFPKIRLHSSMLANEATADVAWRAIEETTQRLPLPYLRMDRLVPRKVLIELSERGPSRAVQHVVKIFRHNHEIVKLLNNLDE